MGIELVFRSHDGQETRITTSGETSVMEAATAQSVDGIVAECRGSCTCATCHVIVTAEWLERLAPPDQLENEMLDILAERAPGSRLSCQIAIKDELNGLTMDIPKSQY
ncbi:2Fe-2S iron-sulfur cluster-binding protein [Nitrobacter sp.]|uniref:2Fe-2S iron-sulfur cluster-binding protein n=1 Tax=Nitrobacter sp. TaxID=29420 RepID=UPI0029CAC3D4|nr:2Fe-2S iron-sulfur cluster-binding protein [Nitrobacter sp.]